MSRKKKVRWRSQITSYAIETKPDSAKQTTVSRTIDERGRTAAPLSKLLEASRPALEAAAGVGLSPRATSSAPTPRARLSPPASALVTA